jgi:hypothetical protein
MILVRIVGYHWQVFRPCRVFPHQASSYTFGPSRSFTNDPITFLCSTTLTCRMGLDTNLDQASGGNILHTLNFESPEPILSSGLLRNTIQSLRDIIHWLRRGKDTLYRYLNHRPYVREPIVATFRSITHSFPPSHPNTTPLADDNTEQRLSLNKLEP